MVRRPRAHGQNEERRRWVGFRVEMLAVAEIAPRQVGVRMHRIAEPMVVSLQREAVQRTEQMEQEQRNRVEQIDVGDSSEQLQEAFDQFARKFKEWYERPPSSKSKLGRIVSKQGVCEARPRRIVVLVQSELETFRPHIAHPESMQGMSRVVMSTAS